MAVNFSGVNHIPKTNIQPQKRVAFTSAQKADTVSFGNAAGKVLMKTEPAKSAVKKVLDFLVKNLGKVKDIVVGLLKKLAKPLQALLAKFKGKGAEEVVKKAAGG